MSLILGIESSCDETAAAVVEAGRAVRSNVIASQHALHAEYRGVVPEIASRAHLERITPVIDEALRDADCTMDNLHAVAIGHAPGLIGSLLVGVSAAKAIAWARSIPLLGVNHVQAHLYAPWLHAADEPATAAVRYPALGLVVSGGHTTLYRVDGPASLKPIGRTIDDAVGEAYDKVAVLLGLPYPGGPGIDRLAQQGDASKHKMPRSLLAPDSLDFSFSGLKTAMLYAVRGRPVGRGNDATFERHINDLSDAERADLAAAFQDAAVGVIITKIKRAVKQLRGDGVDVQSLLVGGGVCANSLLRQRSQKIADDLGLDLHLSAMPYCLDNGAMIAGLGHHLLAAGDASDLNLEAVATMAVV